MDRMKIYLDDLNILKTPADHTESSNVLIIIRKVFVHRALKSQSSIPKLIFTIIMKHLKLADNTNTVFLLSKLIYERQIKAIFKYTSLNNFHMITLDFRMLLIHFIQRRKSTLMRKYAKKFSASSSQMLLHTDLRKKILRKWANTPHACFERLFWSQSLP